MRTREIAKRARLSQSTVRRSTFENEDLILTTVNHHEESEHKLLEHFPPNRVRRI